MEIRGIRGATTVNEDSPVQILAATKELLVEIMRSNPSLKSTDIASAIFTMTDDLQSTFPAKAARDMGWTAVPLMCSREINVPDSLKKCIRVLLLWNTNVPQSEVKHSYLRAAATLRPDISQKNI